MSRAVNVSRRAMLVGGAAAGLLPYRTAAMEGGAAIPLRTIAAARGIRFGTALGRKGLDDPAYCALVERQCALVTPENALKWQALRPSADRFDFAEADRLIAWATRQGLGVRGHTLFWPRQNRLPPWLANGGMPSSELPGLLARHISTVVGRYHQAIDSFDVVNEAIDPDTGGWRASVFSTAPGGIGALVGQAFRAAREAAPDAQLVYNDYMDWGDGSARHRLGVLRMLEALRKDGVPVDALGIQAHVNATPDLSSVKRREKDWLAFLDEVTGMGYRLLVTEFDVDDRDLVGDIAQRDRQIAAYASAWMALVLAYPQLDTIVAWGLTDRLSWLDGFRPRSDGQHKRGCLYDDALKPKPVRDALATAMQAGGSRPVTRLPPH